MLPYGWDTYPLDIVWSPTKKKNSLNWKILYKQIKLIIQGSGHVKTQVSEKWYFYDFKTWNDIINHV